MKEYKYLVGITYKDKKGNINMGKITMILDYEVQIGRNIGRFKEDVNNYVRNIYSVSDSLNVCINGFVPLEECK